MIQTTQSVQRVLAGIEALELDCIKLKLMRAEEDAANLRAAAENMHALYEREFGEKLPQTAAWCGSAQPLKSGSAWCGAAKQSAAWCGAAKQSAAWCGAAK